MNNILAHLRKIVPLVSLVFILGFVVNRFSNSTTPSVADTVTRGRRMIVIRFPEISTEPREEVIIDLGTFGAYASRTSMSADGVQGATVVSDLTADQLQEWLVLRNQWCQTVPGKHTSDSVFEVALRCPTKRNPFGRTEVFTIAANQLPLSLRTLLHDIDSPGCDDPLCGW